MHLLKPVQTSRNTVTKKKNRKLASCKPNHPYRNKVIHHFHWGLFIMSRYTYHFCSVVNIYIYFFPDRYALLSELKCIPFSLLNIQRKQTNVRYTRQKVENAEVKEIRHFLDAKDRFRWTKYINSWLYLTDFITSFFFKKNIIMMSKHSPYNSLGMRY